MEHLELTRDLVIFDLETTGTDPATDRIVEISVLRISPGGERTSRTRRINPERPIPPDATEVHGIRDEDVRDEPSFRKIARGLLDFFGDADLAGFNVSRFDVPLLVHEFRRCGLDLALERRKVVDAMTVFHRMEPRDLSAAVRFYLGREHEGAHGAEADVEATAAVLDAQLARYGDLPRTVDGLDRWCNPVGDDAVDRSGKFVWSGGDVVFAFGKNQGKRLRDIARSNPGYLEWIARSDFPEDAQTIVRDAMAGKYPAAPESTD